MSGALATLPSTSDRTVWSPEEAAAVEAAGLVFTHAYGDRKGEKILAERPIVARFLHTVEKTGLDPLVRQIYCIGRFGSDGLEWSIQTGIDGFRLIAERSGKYAGQDGAEWLTENHGWVEAFIPGLHGDHPLAARVRVYRKDWDRPAVGIAVWDEYKQTKRSGELTVMWKQRGPGQLAKCAESLAFRKAFPQDLSGLYTAEEMESAEPLGSDQGGESSRPARGGITTVADRMRAAEEAASAASAEDIVDGEVVEDEQTTHDDAAASGFGPELDPEIDRAELVRGHISEARSCTSLNALRGVWNDANRDGVANEPDFVKAIEEMRAALEVPTADAPPAAAPEPASEDAAPVTEWAVVKPGEGEATS